MIYGLPWAYQNPFADAEAKFGILENDCRFVGYWRRNEGAIEGLPVEIKASYYLRPGKGALSMLRISARSKRLSFFQPAKPAGTLRTHVSWTWKQKRKFQWWNGKFTLTVNGHDFRAVQVESIAP